MDVRCERCKARYAIPDEQITAEGLILRCTACGHAFRVRKKELVVTVAVSGEEATQAIPAHELVTGGMVATPVPQAAPAAESLILRSLDGSVRPVPDLATLQRWIAERRAVRDDELSRGGGPYLRLGLLPDLAAILGLVEAADRAARQPARHEADPFGRIGLDEPPVQARPPPAGPRPDPMAARPVEAAPSAPMRVPVAVDAPAAVAAPAAPAAAAIAPAQEAEPLDDGELASIGRKRGKLGLAAAAALLVLLGAAAWLFSPAEVAGPLPTVPPPDRPAAAEPPPAQPPPVAPAAPPPAEPPATAPTPAAAEPPAPSPAPAPAPAEAAPAATPAPIEPAAEPPKKPVGGKARLAQARALRERGETAKALEAFQKLAREEPDNVGALTGRGLCYFELNQYGSAVASFQQALVIAPDDPDATMGLAETYRQTGKKAEAVALYQRYLVAHPDGEEAAVARNALSQLKE